MNPYKLPGKIEQESFSIIDSLVDMNKFPKEERPVIRRVVHATGDPAVAETMVFSQGVLPIAWDAVYSGADIITDVEMVRMGISKKRLARTHNSLHCAIRDEQVAKNAHTNGTTRAREAFVYLKDKINGGIVVVGNAPTALFTLLDMVSELKVAPRLVIGLPVGFVGAAESKQALSESSIPHITNHGTRGGSSMAVATINALIIQAELIRRC